MTKSGFDLDEIERLLAAATVGDWWNEGCGVFYAPNGWLRTLIYDEGGHTEDDAALIVTLKRSAPAMIAAIRELRATVATLGDSARAGANVLDAKDAEIRELRAENARLREALFNATALIGHSVPMDTTALVAGEQLTAQGVWLQGRDALAGAKP